MFLYKYIQHIPYNGRFELSRINQSQFVVVSFFFACDLLVLFLYCDISPDLTMAHGHLISHSVENRVVVCIEN